MVRFPKQRQSVPSRRDFFRPITSVVIPIRMDPITEPRKTKPAAMEKFKR